MRSVCIPAFTAISSLSLGSGRKLPDACASLRENDRRAQWPRYQKEAFRKNLELVESVKELAEKKGCTPGQLALAWVHAQVNLAVRYLPDRLGHWHV